MDCLEVYASPHSGHQCTMADAIVEGCKVHGDPVRRVTKHRDLKGGRVCVWGWRKGAHLHAAGNNVLVMERGYIGDRFKWFSLGWNGLNARAKMPRANDGGSRWESLFAQYMQPWRYPLNRRDKYVLIMGQVPTDKSLNGMVFGNWVNKMVSDLRLCGERDVVFRPHPLAPLVRCNVPTIGGTLAEAMAGARVVVTYNSNSGVDAVLAGVPAVTMDEGAMAYEVTSHNPCAPPYTPNRDAWAYNMAFAQWLPAEVSSGVAWEFLRKLV